MIKGKDRKTLFSRAMQVLLLALTVSTFLIGDITAFVNSGIGLIITFLPSIARRKYDVTLDPLLSLWITSAVFFHAYGAVHLSGKNIYNTIWWWDHFTHALSASVVAAAGYISMKVLDEYSEEVHFPRKLLFVFIIVFIMAFGVIWELLEFALGLLAEYQGGNTILTQYGVEDTMKDMIFNTMGGIVVAIIGEAYLSGTVEELERKLKSRVEEF